MTNTPFENLIQYDSALEKSILTQEISYVLVHGRVIFKVLQLFFQLIWFAARLGQLLLVALLQKRK